MGWRSCQVGYGGERLSVASLTEEDVCSSDGRDKLGKSSAHADTYSVTSKKLQRL